MERRDPPNPSERKHADGTHRDTATSRDDANHTPPAGVSYDLDDLIAGITDENRHDLVDFGEPVGREVW